MYENFVQKKRTSTHKCPGGKEAEQSLEGVTETYHDLRPKDTNKEDTYQNPNHRNSAHTYTLPCEETTEHEYDTCQNIKSRENRRSPTAWLAVSIFLCLGVVGLTVYDICFALIPPCQCHSASVHNNEGNDTMVCLECSHLMVQIITQSQACRSLLAIKSEDGVHKCCAGNATHLTALLALCASQPDGTPVNTARTQEHVIRLTPASAHKRLLPPPEREEEGQGPFYSASGTRTLRLDPDNSDPHWEHTRGVRIEAAGMVVQFPGLYYVYSSVHYKPSTRHANDSCQNEIWLHYVFRLSPNIPDNEGQLLQTIYSGCGMCFQNSGTAFTGGVFNLKEEDYIQIEASKPSMVNYDSGSTYLGLIMLASEGK